MKENFQCHKKTFILMNKENEKVVYGMQEKKCIHTWVFFMGMIISLGILIISRKLKPWHLV